MIEIFGNPTVMLSSFQQNPKPFSSDRNIRRQELLMDQQVEDRQKEIARLEEEMRKLWQASYVPPVCLNKDILFI